MKKPDCQTKPGGKDCVCCILWDERDDELLHKHEQEKELKANWKKCIEENFAYEDKLAKAEEEIVRLTQAIKDCPEIPVKGDS